MPKELIQEKNRLKQLQLVAPHAALAVLFSIVQGKLQPPSQMLFVTEIWHRPLVAIDALGFAPFKFQDHSTVADHYLYFSAVFLFP